MIKLIFCLRKSPSISLDEFHRYWREEHAALVKQHAQTLRIRRYTQSATATGQELASILKGRGDGEAYDGVAELWWDSVEDVLTASATEGGRAAARALYRDEERFIDLANSRIFYATEQVVVSEGE